MSAVLPERVVKLMEERGITQSALARMAGVEQPTIYRLIKGVTLKPRYLHEVARALGTTTDYLVGEIDDPDAAPARLADRRQGFRGFEPEPGADQVAIEHIDLRFGMGGTFLDNPVESARRSFPREWLRSFTTASPEQLVWTEGDGDSMEPTIRSGEPILIDRGQTNPLMADGIWCFAFGEVGMIKRLRPMPDGNVEIHSDNPLVRTALATEGELKIFGRVIAKVGRL